MKPFIKPHLVNLLKVVEFSYWNTDPSISSRVIGRLMLDYREHYYPILNKNSERFQIGCYAYRDVKYDLLEGDGPGG